MPQEIKKQMRIARWFYFLFVTCSGLIACSSGPAKQEYTDTPTSGDILIVVDESYQPLIQVQLDTFMKIYKYARIRAKYLPETEVFNELITNDSVRLAIVARPLDSAETSYFDGRKIIPRVTRAAIDAVALVMNKSNTDTTLKLSALDAIFCGRVRTWKQIHPGSVSDSIRVVFDKSGSSNTRYLQETFRVKHPLPSNWFAVQSNAEVIEYVSNNPGALGVVSVNWISDRDDSSVNAFLKKVTVVEIASADTSGANVEYYKPYQAYIALKQYPLTRDVLMISREGRNGLGTGFASFVAGDLGQRLVRLMGMLPATMPVRIVKINS